MESESQARASKGHAILANTEVRQTIISIFQLKILCQFLRQLPFLTVEITIDSNLA